MFLCYKIGQYISWVSMYHLKLEHTKSHTRHKTYGFFIKTIIFVTEKRCYPTSTSCTYLGITKTFLFSSCFLLNSIIRSVCMCVFDDHAYNFDGIQHISCLMMEKAFNNSTSYQIISYQFHFFNCRHIWWIILTEKFIMEGRLFLYFES